MGLNQRGTQKPDERGDDAEPAENDLYVPRKASSEVWNAFRLSVADPNRAWCTICHVWLAVSVFISLLKFFFGFKYFASTTLALSLSALCACHAACLGRDLCR